MGARRLALFAAIAAAGLSAGGTAALSLAQNSDQPPASKVAPATSTSMGFAALARAQRADDRLPTGVLARFGTDNPTGPQVDPSTARKVGHVADADLYVAEGPSSFCTLSVDAAGWSGGCTSKARAASGEPQVSFGLVESPDGDDYRVWGVAPDAVASAAIVTKGGARVPVPIQDGAFDVTTDDPGTSFVWTDAQGIEHAQPVVLPPAR